MIASTRSGDHEGVLSALFAAAQLATGVLAAEEVARRWHDESKVPGFSVGGLAAHLYAGIRRLEIGLNEVVPEDATTVGLVEFYGCNWVEDPPHLDGMHAAILRDAERQAGHGVDTMRRRLSDVVDRLRDRLASESLDRVVPVLQVRNGVTPLSEYLATRVVELVVHSDDLAMSAGLLDQPIPPAAAEVVIGVCVELARARYGDLGVVRAFTRVERAGPDRIRVL